MKWQGLLTQGLVEFIDVEEEESAMIAMFPSDLLSAKNPKFVCFLIYLFICVARIVALIHTVKFTHQ